MEIRRSYDRLISTMGFPMLVRWRLYIESGPCSAPTEGPSLPLTMKCGGDVILNIVLISSNWTRSRCKPKTFRSEIYWFLFSAIRTDVPALLCAVFENNLNHGYHNDVTWTLRRLKSSTIWLFHRLVQANSKRHQRPALLTCCECNSPMISGFPS